MTTTFYQTNNDENYHTKFGGTVYISDFNTSHSNGNIAARIVRDQRFDEQCRKSLLNRRYS